TIGAAGALFIIATSLLQKGDEIIVVRPNYATNIETPRALGANVRYLDLRFEDGWRIDMKALKKAVGKKTKYISVTHPHNPTGVCLGDDEMRELVRIAEQKDAWLLVDETYRDMAFGPKLPPACDYSERVISVSSLSKTYGLPGLRTGWIFCRDKKLMETFLAAKEQIYICGPIVDETISYRYLQEKDKYYPSIIADIRSKFDIVRQWMESQDGFEWVAPAGGAVCFPRMKRPWETDIDLFYEILMKEYGTYVGPGHWFEMPRHYMRVGFGWPSHNELSAGLEAMTRSIEAATLL
ncbi:MAG: pyridoxal phosphate-dependent aminotransferase, partial [Bacteroidetes bacterium]|nr:pyridoxal phosphate-dependent aminotransferase [Bacteroidota bacterium]